MEYTQNSDFCSLQSDILSIKSDRAEMNESFEKSESDPADNDGLFKKVKVGQLYMYIWFDHMVYIDAWIYSL